jgi:S-formylglutathione hydrolase FrmB
MENEMMLLNAIDQLLDHIKAVENDTIDLSKESLLKLSAFMEKNSLEIDDDVAEALQYQDIISQQLTATIEAIENVQQSISHFNRAYEEDEAIAVASMESLQSKLGNALERAKDKRQAFSGNVKHENDDDAIEFF